MRYLIIPSKKVRDEIASIRKSGDQALLKKIDKALGFLAENPHHPSLQTKKYQSMTGPNSETVFESYISTSGAAHRMWWMYGPNEGEIEVISVLDLGPHPKIQGKK